MLFEVINPSDKIIFEAESGYIAGLTVLLVGEGKYGCAAENGDTVFPIMLFGGEKQLQEWLEQHEVQTDHNEALASNREAIIEALNSFLVSDMGMYKRLVSTFTEEGSLRKYNDDQRSSMNDICGYAYRVSDYLQKQLDEESA